jgi:Tol biopolymer transport system component
MTPDDEGRASRGPTRKITAALTVVATLAGVGVVVMVRHLREQPPPPPPVVRLAFPAPPGTELGAADEPLDAAISPDQRQVAFVATANGVTRLWRRALESVEAEAVPHSEGARLPAWKPTGAVIAFFAGERLKQVSIADGAVRDLADAPGPAGVTWLPDGSLLFASASNPIRHLAGGRISDATALHAGDRAHVFPMAADDQGGFVYVAARDDGRRIVRLHVNGQDRDLTETTGHAQLIGDRLLYVRDGALLTQTFDAASGALTGRSTLIAADVGASGGRAFFAASPRVLLTASAAARARQLTWVDADQRDGTVGEPGDFWQVRLSPDDRYAAATLLDPLLRTLDIIVLATSGSSAREPLTSALAADSDPVWSPDGSQVLFRSMQDGVPNLYARRAHVLNVPDVPMLKSELDETPSDWQDSTIIFGAPMKGTRGDIWQYERDAREVTGLATSSFNESDARLSPDGDWMAYVSDESGRADIYAQPFPDGPRVRVSFNGGTRPRWSHDGHALYFLRQDEVMRADMQKGTSTSPTAFAPATVAATAAAVRDFDVSHKSDRLLLLLPVETHAEPMVNAVIDWTSLR